jgi:RNA recognition motif-containing protein
MDIYIGNLNLQLEEDSIEKLFNVFGLITNITLIKDRESGKSKGFGFVKMPNAIEAERAINELHNIEVAGRRLVVYEAKPKPEKSETKQAPLNLQIKHSQKEKYFGDYEESISFKIPREKIDNPVEYSKTISEDGFVRLKFNS